MNELRRCDKISNNVAYCSMLLGDLEAAGLKFSKMAFSRSDVNWPIWQHNRAIFNVLLGKQEVARGMLIEALEWIKAVGPKFDARNALCMLLLSKGGCVPSRDKLPIDVAILLNMVVLGSLAVGEAARELRKRYREESSEWIRWIQTEEGAEGSG